jgi:hypothetical protein
MTILLEWPGSEAAILADRILDLLQQVQPHRGEDHDACDFHVLLHATTAGLACVQDRRRVLLRRVKQLNLS